MSVKQKFIDPVIQTKAKEVANMQYAKDGRPFPAIVEISESGTCNRKCSFCPRSAPDWKDIKEFISDGGKLGGNPDKNIPLGIEISTGSLGHGLSIGAGIALAT